MLMISLAFREEITMEINERGKMRASKIKAISNKF